MKALVIGTTGNEAHEEKVRDAFVLGYNDAGGSITADEVVIRSTSSLDFHGGFDYCKANDIPVMICSYTGVASRLAIAQANYPDVTLFMPTGKNEPGEIFPGKIPQVICITGAGDVANETADNVEFIAPDPIESDEQDYSSYANGYIAGQILYIAETLGCSIWEARYRAAMTGSEDGTWEEINGYGFIDVPSALAYEGKIPKEPFLPLSCSLLASREEIIIGEDSELTWTSDNALAVKLNGVEKPESGSETVSPSETTEYILTAENNSGICSSAVTITVKEETINGENEMPTEKIYTAVIREVEILKANGEVYRSGLLTDANLILKASPVKRRLSGSDVVLGYDTEFSAELAEIKGVLDDLKRFNNEVCTILFDTEEGAENAMQTLNVADGVFTPVFEKVRVNISEEANLIEPGKSVIVIRGSKRIPELRNHVFIFDEERLQEIKNRYSSIVMDFNTYGDLDMNSVAENYDFNN